jgi:histidine triad (HIT) family protein
MPSCLFCGIVERRVPARVVHEDDQAVAFEDIDPQAPVHLLIVPRRHLATLNEVGGQEEQLMGRLLSVAARLARERGVAERGWRIVANVNADAQQVVFHVHLHLLAGRPFAWPPG